MHVALWLACVVVVSCLSGFPVCGTTSPYCANLTTDRSNCGTCGNACVGSDICIGGICGVACSGGQTSCAASGGTHFCATDPNHCGTCSTVCPASAPMCVAGSCIACPPVPSGALVYGMPTRQYGYCWCLGMEGRTCDAVCSSLGLANVATAAQTSYTSSCSG